MAHAARLGELALGLITSITTTPKDDNAIKSLKDQTLKGFKDQSNARTNQFEVRDRLSGLVEKFGVLNREDIAKALQVRLEELPSKSRWMPEILSLLLCLSDQPVQNTKLKDLEELSRPVTPPPQLTWEDILADDPLNEDGLWDDVDRGYHSSGDDATANDEEGSEPTTSTDATSVGDDDIVTLARLQVVQLDPSALDEVHAARENLRSSTKESTSSHISELVLVRESFMMLHGLPTDVYHLEPRTGVVTTGTVDIATAAASVVNDVLENLADTGTRLKYLRKWGGTEQKAAYLQSVQASIQSLLTSFGTQLGDLELRLARPAKDTIVSIINLRSDIEILARPLLLLSDLVRRTDKSVSGTSSPFALLDALHDEACIAQISADAEVFTAVLKVLLAGLRTYLNPVRCWVDGTLPMSGCADFFVMENDVECALNKIWHDRFTLRTLANGQPSAPTFVQAFVNRAFAFGKARAFLSVLDPAMDISISDQRGAASAGMDTAELQLQLQANPLLPFQQLLDDTLSRWMQETGMDCTPLVRTRLLYDHGLIRTLTSLDYVFFAKDGSLFQMFADRLFERINRSREAWRGDEFLLTELAQSTIGCGPDVDTDSVAVRVSRDGDEDAARPVVRALEHIELRYVLPWSIQNVFGSATLSAHSKTFALLLQIYYAKCLLRTELLTLRNFDSKTTTLSSQITAMMKLRWRLIWFVEVLASHITDTAWTLHHTMTAAMEAADSIDTMVSVWAGYEHRLPTALLLAPNLAPIKDAVVGVLQLCERSAQLWKQLMPAPLATGSQSSLSPITTGQHDGIDVSPLLEEFERSVSFINAGLRGVSRAGGETALEALAERLDWHGS